MMEIHNDQPSVPVQATIAGKRILVRMKKNQEDIAFIRTLGYARWDAMAFCWVIPCYAGGLIEKMNHFFGNRLQWIDMEKNEPEKKAPPVAAEPGVLIIIRYIHGRVMLIFKYDPKLIGLIKKHPFYCWDSEKNCWTLPYTDKIREQLSAACSEMGWQMKYFEDIRKAGRKPQGVPREKTFTKECPGVFREKLTVLRYSPKTISIYCTCLREFINYFPDKNIDDITREEIITFQRYLVEQRKVSTSYQNQSVNAIKFYYEKVMYGKREIYYIERPRKEKCLPEVLSEEEVGSLIRCIENLKHRCIIMFTYSAGLRIGELLNMKIGDIDSKRMLVIIRQGKGRKDRVTLLSPKVLRLLREYYRIYHPREYLFEGATRGRYSERAVQNILKLACCKAGIKRHVTMHTLRHSFATHLLEHNTDIRYIQELLGHTNPKTTQIYTHITTKGLDQLRSPLDNIDL
ncbi:MAG: site-specific tyrosine recombinase/integron integrase [Bacteroidota bacterium]